jgi:hypothetical protein
MSIRSLSNDAMVCLSERPTGSPSAAMMAPMSVATRRRREDRSKRYASSWHGYSDRTPRACGNSLSDPVSEHTRDTVCQLQANRVLSEVHILVEFRDGDLDADFGQ